MFPKEICMHELLIKMNKSIDLHSFFGITQKNGTNDVGIKEIRQTEMPNFMDLE